MLQSWVPQVAGHPGNTPHIPNVEAEALGEKQLFPWTLTGCSSSRSGSLNVHFASSGGADLFPFSKPAVMTHVAFLTMSPLGCDFSPRSQKTQRIFGASDLDLINGRDEVAVLVHQH